MQTMKTIPGNLDRFRNEPFVSLIDVFVHGYRYYYSATEGADSVAPVSDEEGDDDFTSTAGIIWMIIS